MAEGVGLKTSSRDEMEITLGPDASQKKVELDLDDAPFLHEDKDESLPAVADDNAPAMTEEQASEAAGKKSQKRKKLLLFGGVGLLALSIVAAAAWWFLGRTPPPPPDLLKPDVIVVPSKKTPATPPQYLKALEPFVVERKNVPDGKRFLICKFSTLTTDAALGNEMDRKMIPLRDALYYYLHGKSGEFLLAPENAPAIKGDLVAVLNGYLTMGKINDILFESYLSE